MKREREEATDGGGNKRARPSHDHRNNGGSNGPGGSNGGGRNGKVEVRTLKDEREQDPHRLAQRQKQIDYGKNTLGYDRYCAMVPKHKRRKGEHPMTPDKTRNVSKKQFDGMIRRWRQALHNYDPPELVERLRAAEQQATEAPDVGQAAPAASDRAPVNTDDADMDPELDDLDPSKQTPATSSASIFDAFNDDEDAAVDFEDDDDDLL